MEKIILFDGSSVGSWKTRAGGDINWINDGEAMTVNSGDIISKDEYGDAFIHVEFKVPDMPSEVGQCKGNSGVYIHGCYELQILDSYERKEPDMSDCGAIYSMYAPSMNACKPADEWQTYDILIRAPRFSQNGEIIEHGRLSVLQNGLPVQNNVILERATPGGITENPVANGPLLLQDHGNKVSYRNIWLVKLYA